MRPLIQEVVEHTDAYHRLLNVAERLNQTRFIPARKAYGDVSVLVGAFMQDQCVGFLRFVILVIGHDQQRPPILDTTGQLLRGGYVEAFGVLPNYRRRGIGQELQEYAMAL